MMKHKPFLISALVLTALNSCASAVHAVSDETVRLNNDGVKLLNDSKIDQAIAKLTEALRADPTYARSRENLAIAYNNKGISLQSEPLKSVVCFRHCLFFDPNNVVALQNLDSVIKQLGKDPTKASDRIAMGTEARKAGDFRSAVVELRAGLKIKDDPTVHETLGDVLRVLDQNEAAIDQYKAAVTAKASANLYTKLGQALSSVRRSDEAIDAYEKAVSLAPYDRDALDSLVTGWQSMVQQNPTEPSTHLGLAKAFAKTGDFGQADAEARSARSLSPNRANLEADQFLAELPALKKSAGLRRHINNGNDLRARRMYAQAIDEFLEANRLVPDDDESLVKLGETYALINDKKNAEEAFKTVLQRSPRNAAAKQGFELASAGTQSTASSSLYANHSSDAHADALAVEGSKFFKDANYVCASDKFRQALELQPQNASFWRKFAEANYQMENFNVALNAYQRALQYSTAEADGLYVIATIYEHYGDADKAIKAYQDFVNFRSVGLMANQATNRIVALSGNPKATLKISTSAELAAQKAAENSYDSARNFIKEKKWDDSVTALNRAVSIRPNQGKYQYLLGCAYAGKGDLSQATDALKRATALEPENELYKLKLDALIQNRTASPIQIAPPVADATVSTAKNYALLIGTDYYQDNEFKQLRNPILDCKTIGDVLKTDYGWNVTVVENPTKTQLKGELRRLANQNYNDSDQLFVFFAGHGLFDDVTNMAYLVTTESKLADLERESFISASELIGLIDHIKCPHTLLTLDVCHGGTFDDYFINTLAEANRDSGNKKMTLEQLLARKQVLKTRKLLTASGKESVSDGVPGQHSPFAGELLDTLRQYGGTDGYYSLGDIIKKVERVKPGPRASKFGSDAPGSDFFFIPKKQ